LIGDEPIIVSTSSAVTGASSLIVGVARHGTSYSDVVAVEDRTESTLFQKSYMEITEMLIKQKLNSLKFEETQHDDSMNNNNNNNHLTAVCPGQPG